MEYPISYKIPHLAHPSPMIRPIMYMLYLRETFWDAFGMGQFHGPVKMAAATRVEPAPAALRRRLVGVVGLADRPVCTDTGQCPFVGQIHQVR
jgi:hypothetical protein